MKRYLIVGYKGEIGSFLLQGLLRVMPKALDIFCVDINETEEEVTERIEKSDIIFLCVPYNQTVDWIIKYQELLKNKTIIEQCSRKEWIYNDKRLKELKHIIGSFINPGCLKSMHILFRPSQTPDLKDRDVVILRSPSDFSSDELLMIESITQSKLVFINNPEEHDREMAIQQALVHRTIISLGNRLEKGKCSTFIGKKIIELKDRIMKGNKELCDFIQQNEYIDSPNNWLQSDMREFTIDKYWKKK